MARSYCLTPSYTHTHTNALSYRFEHIGRAACMNVCCSLLSAFGGGQPSGKASSPSCKRCDGRRGKCIGGIPSHLTTLPIMVNASTKSGFGTTALHSSYQSAQGGSARGIPAGTGPLLRCPSPTCAACGNAAPIAPSAAPTIPTSNYATTTLGLTADGSITQAITFNWHNVRSCSCTR